MGSHSLALGSSHSSWVVGMVLLSSGRGEGTLKLATGAQVLGLGAFGSGGLAWVETQCHVVFGSECDLLSCTREEEEDLFAETWQLFQPGLLQAVVFLMWGVSEFQMWNQYH